jgi:N6-adenosine-specific RNA methylase IME4
MSEGLPTLLNYDAACRLLAEAVRVDEVRNIRDIAIAMRVYAKQAKNREAEADAVALRMRAVRRLAQLMQAQKETVGLSKGGRPAKTGSFERPGFATLAMQGIDKHLAHQARTLGALSDSDFETVVTDARDKVARAVRNAVREIEIEQERESYAARIEQGGTVDHLEALLAAGKTFGVICPDFPWEFEVYSGKGKQRSAERYYDTWPLERIKTFAPLIGRLAAPDCALLLWAVWPEHPGAFEVITACGFDYKTVGFVWVKTTKSASAITPDGDGLHTGTGYHTRANTEVALLATRGAPRRLSNDVHQVIIAPVGEQHSAKPDEVYRRIERLYPGPYLELFARKPRDGWTTWGNEIAPPVPGQREAAR